MIAKLLESRPSFSNLFGLLRPSPSKTSLTSHQQQPPSPLGTPRRTSGGGGGTPRAGSATSMMLLSDTQRTELDQGGLVHECGECEEKARRGWHATAQCTAAATYA